MSRGYWLDSMVSEVVLVLQTSVKLWLVMVGLNRNMGHACALSSQSCQHMAESLARMPTARFQDHGTSVP